MSMVLQARKEVMSSFVFVQPHLRFGGAERQTVLVANALAARGHEVHVVLHTGDGGLGEQVASDVRVHVLGVASHLATPEVARRMLLVLRGLPSSLVVVKLWSSVLAAALIDGKAAVAHHAFNYCEDLDPTDHARYIRLGGLKQRLVGRVFRSRALLSANTETVASSMVDVYGLQQRPAVIPSTVDAEAVRRSAVDNAVERSDVFTVASVGSLIRRKGHDVTWAALRSLDVPVHWRIVGAGPLERELAALRDPRGLVTVSVEPAIAEPYAWMAAADVLVHSARSEAWGIVILESLAAGTPVLAADSIGPAEMRRCLGGPDEFLELFENGSSDDLRKRLVRRVGQSRPSAGDLLGHIAPFSLGRAVDQWEARASASTAVAA